MILKSVTINGYKSIMTPQTLDLSTGFITLLGKNGGGKSNVLEGIKLAFESNLPHKYSAEAEITLLLDNEDMINFSGRRGKGKQTAVTVKVAPDLFKVVGGDKDLVEELYLDEKVFRAFCEYTERAFYKKCYLLNNENGLFFGGERMKLRDVYSYSKNPIEDAFFAYAIASGYFGNEKIDGREALEAKVKASDKQKLCEFFEEYLNSKIPKFERGMVDRLEVCYENGEFCLYFIEKNGFRTPFEETSLGRRWYFNYLFVRTSLRKGDVLLIDEPGAFLHPQAQKETLEELENLARSGIIVVISTHSPYMISASESNEIVEVTFPGDSGTVLKRVERTGLKDIYNEIGLASFNDILLGLNKKAVLVEGRRDKTCIESVMRYFGMDPDLYQINILSGYGNVARIIDFYLRNKIPLAVLLDDDSRRTVTALRVYSNDGETVPITEISPKKLRLAFAGTGCDRRDIEGLFSEEDRKRHFERVSGGKTKVGFCFPTTIKEFGLSQETADNFRALFINLGFLPKTSKNRKK